MTTSDYILDIALIGLVFLQVRGRRLSLRMLAIPVGIVIYVATKYLHGVPTAGNDVLLVVLGAGVGISLGIACGFATRLHASADGVIAKAGILAAVLWVAGVGTRLAFQLYATHGGGAAIERFSVAHHITSNQAWVATLILMALGEAIARTAVLTARAYRLDPSILTPKAHTSTNMDARWANSEHGALR
jgi:hypothetical protein